MNKLPPPSHPKFALPKLEARLASPACRDADRLAFLVFSGSFSPVHVQHIRAFEIARAAMEQQGFSVVGGFLAPSSDAYVQEKLSSLDWSLERRVHLCEIACAESDWIDVCPWGEFSSYRLSAGLRERLEYDCAQLLKRRPLTGLELMGSDTAIRLLDKVIGQWKETEADGGAWYQGRIVCCLVRPGPDRVGQIEHIQRSTAPAAAHLGVEVVLIDSSDFEQPLEAVSSSSIRELISRGAWTELRSRGYLEPEVLRFLEEER